MINATTKARFALFNRAPDVENDDPEKTYPVMTGFVESDTFRKNVSAFAKTASNGKQYLSLAIANEHDEETFYGTLFRDEKDGKKGSYYGFITKSVETGVDEDGKKIYATVWQLGISAKVHTPEGKKKFIGGEVYPTKKGSEVAATVESDELAF